MKLITATLLSVLASSSLLVANSHAGEYTDMNVTTIDAWAYGGTAAGFDGNFDGPLTGYGDFQTIGYNSPGTVGASVTYDGWVGSNPWGGADPVAYFDRFWVDVTHFDSSGTPGVGLINVDFTLSQDCWLYEWNPGTSLGISMMIDGTYITQAQLTAGTHTLTVEILFDEMWTGSYNTSFTYLTYPVPAPGVLAALGMAGALGGRRRR